MVTVLAGLLVLAGLFVLVGLVLFSRADEAARRSVIALVTNLFHGHPPDWSDKDSGTDGVDQ